MPLGEGHKKNWGTVQVDVDSISHLLKFYGHHPQENHQDNPIYRLGLARFRELFRGLNVKATFMVVGEDILNVENQEIIKTLADDGHEIANHSFRHLYGFSRLNSQAQYEEIHSAGERIKEVTGQGPAGFRAPGWDVDCRTISILEELGYEYDSSILPSYLNPIMKLAHRLMSIQNRSQRPGGMGSPMLSLSPNYPYYPHNQHIWKRTPKRPILEIPCTTLPFGRIPFYSNFNMLLGRRFFDLCLAAIRRHPCNYVFHAVDLMAPDELDQGILVHPNAKMPLQEKQALCGYFVKRLKEHYKLVVTTEMAKKIKHTPHSIYNKDSRFRGG